MPARPLADSTVLSRQASGASCGRASPAASRTRCSWSRSRGRSTTSAAARGTWAWSASRSSFLRWRSRCPAGQWVDRVDRRGVLAAALALQAVAAVVLAVGSMTGWVDRHVIFTMCIVMGVARALQMPSSQAHRAGARGHRRAAARVRGKLDAAQDRGDRRTRARRLPVRVRGCGHLRLVPRVLRHRALSTSLRNPAHRASCRRVAGVGRIAHGGLRVHLAQETGAGGDLARSLRGAAGRRDGAAADLRKGHPRARDPGGSGSCAPRLLLARSRWDWPSRTGRWPATWDAACSCRWRSTARRSSSSDSRATSRFRSSRSR